MESREDQDRTFVSLIKKIVFRILPFFVVIVLILAVMIPLNARIDSKKDALKEQQAKGSREQKALTNVVTMEIKPDLITEKISLPGSAKPWVELEVVSEVAGKITRKTAAEGQQVQKGDVLAIIDTSDYQNAVDSALASWETALATEKRLKALVKKNFVTQSQLDDAVARVKTTKAALDNARLNLKRCRIVSPMNGVVDRVHIENGSYLNVGDPVAKILQIDRLKIVVGIPESDVDAVRKLKTFSVTIDALGGKTYTGHFHYLYKTSDSFARLYNLEIRVNNPDQQILPDMFARVKIIKNQDSQGLAVPMYSLVSYNEAVGVYVENGGIVRFQPVLPGFMDGWKIQIKDGLMPNQNVVVVGHRLIEDGEKVNVTRTISDIKELNR